jgi:hypothetical protein
MPMHRSEPVRNTRPGWEAFQPIHPPPPEDIPVHAPIRDDSHVGATEDLDREPDGVPHSVVGFTALFAVMLAVLLCVIFFVSSATGRIGASLLLVFAVPVLFGRLKRKAERERDPVHPSR